MTASAIGGRGSDSLRLHVSVPTGLSADSLTLATTQATTVGMYLALADVIVLAHLAFVAFVVFGGLLVLRWPRVACVQLPAAAWGVLIELTGGTCPLTPLETTLRTWGGGTGYTDGFVGHYFLPVLYPAFLTPDIQLTLGMLVVGFNFGIYAHVMRWPGAR